FKGDASNKVNATISSNKKQPAPINSEVKHTSNVDGEGSSDQEDEGQWVTQSAKQVGNRNRNKGKTESSPSALSNRKNVSEKRSIPTTSNTNTTSSSSLTNKTDLDIEPTIPSTKPVKIQEPIEICQLLPTSENRYTANDSWWKETLNKQQTFSVNDIGDWPEREQDEQYIVKVQRIIPVNHRNDDEL
ncbi:unnamed protein product, partial [Adineta steineri]